MPFSNTAPLRDEIARVVPSRPFKVEFWDGTELPSTENGAPVPTFSVRSPKAIAQALIAPGQLGLGRAYATGTLAIDDIDAVMALLQEWSPPPIETRDKIKLMGGAVRAAGLTVPPRPPAAELRPKGRRHTQDRDQRAVRHHYDVSNDFFRLLLGPSLTYSCALFSQGASTLEEAQEAKLEMVCRKLELREGERVLDVGCGWGAFAVHAAHRHGVHVTGITLSAPQAELASARAREAGVGDRVDVRVADYRDLRGETWDAVASIGMVEHVGARNIDEYAARLASVLRPGGRLLNHGIARLRHSDGEAGPFSERFVFPDAAPLHVSRVLFAIERSGLEPDHVEGFRHDYAETLRHWARNVDDNLGEAVRLAGEQRVRVWRLYLRAARNGFESGFTSIFQVRARRA